MDEFSLIDAVIAALGPATGGRHVVLGPGDDGSITEVPEDSQLVSSIDTLVAGVHFPSAAPGELVGHRALGVSVSDLAAMGATAQFAIVSVTLEEDQQAWLLDFARGMGVAGRRMGIAIIGGNLARGPLNVAVSVHGIVPRNSALRRSGAKPGDHLYVSGKIGGAALGLLRSGGTNASFAELSKAGADDGLARYYLPSPRLALGCELRGIASAAIDVSDGLFADLGHLCLASGVGAVVDGDKVPLAAGAELESAVVAGDDYELLFTVPPERQRALLALAEDVSEIGAIVAGSECVLEREGRRIVVGKAGYRHFS